MRIFFIILFISNFAFGQEQNIPKQDREMDVNWYSNGWGLNYNQRFFLKNNKFTLGYSIGLQTLKHTQESKIFNENVLQSGTYTYGKVNRAFLVNTDISIRSYTVSPNFGKVNIFQTINIGPAFCFMRPVYVFAIDNQDPEQSQIKERKYDQFIHENNDLIAGDAGWYKGFDELMLNTGISMGVNTGFVWYQDIYLQSLSIGLKAYYFHMPLALLINHESRIIFAANLKISFGKTTFK